MLQEEHPDGIIFPVWFWGDDLASLAWQIAPTLGKFRLQNNIGGLADKELANSKVQMSLARKPVLVALADDVFSNRAQRLATTEPNITEAARFQIIAKKLRKAEAEIYEHVDAVTFITKEDLELGSEMLDLLSYKRSRNRYVEDAMPIKPLLLRPSLPFSLAPKGYGKSYDRRKGLLFLGNGGVETNYQGVYWFLKHCWTRIRNSNPNITLTIAGSLPENYAMQVRHLNCVHRKYILQKLH